MAQQWNIKKGDTEKKVEEKVLIEWIEQGDVPADILIRASEADAWKVISQTEEFGHLYKTPDTQKSPDLEESTRYEDKEDSQEHPPHEEEKSFSEEDIVQEGVFSIKKALVFGFRTLFKNLGFFLPMVVILAAFTLFDAFVIERLVTGNVLRLVVYLGYYILYFILTLGVIKATILFCDNDNPSLGVLFSQSHLLLKYIAATFLYSAIVMAGFVLLIVPGVIWMIKFFFYDYFIVDRNAGIIESIEMSDRITKGFKWKILLMGLVFVGLNLLGLFMLGIGLLVTVPATLLATAYIYRQLEENHSSQQPGDAGS